MIARREYVGRRRVEDGVNFILAWTVALIVGGVVVLIVVALLLFAAQPSIAADERQIRRDCTWDALRYCKAEIVTADRSKIINCMVENKDKLRPKCRQHMW